MKGILATKIGMTQIIGENGVIIPVTVLEATPSVVTQIKTVETDGYNAIQVGYMEKAVKEIKDGKEYHRHGATKAEKGHFDKAGVTPKMHVCEFRVEDTSIYSLGQEIKVDIFEAGEKIDASAISKGKGFQGAIKRHGQSRGPMAHGSKYHRHAGSNGAASDPSKVFKGKKMPGHMGCVKVTTQNLEVVRVDANNNLLLVKGAVPGPKKSVVTIKNAVKA